MTPVAFCRCRAIIQWDDEEREWYHLSGDESHKASPSTESDAE